MNNLIEVNLAQLNERLIHMQELMNTPGWKVFEQKLREEARMALANAVKSNDPYATAKYLAAHATIEQLLSWPLREATLAADTIRQHAEAEQAHTRRKR